MRLFPYYYKDEGFSMIELMVVISIVAILIALGSVSYTTAQKKARDSSRRSEILSIRDGFEQYFSEIGSYDADAGCATVIAEVSIFPAGAPAESKPGWDAYYYACTLNDFTVCAHLESDTGNSDMGTSPAVPSFDNSGDEEWFCMVNQQ